SGHRYRITIRAPGGPLVFSVGDPQSGAGDNSGSFVVKVYPVGKIELVDPYPDLLPLDSYLGDPDLLAGLGSQVSAAVTDGGTVLLVRIESDEAMTLSLTDPGGFPAAPAWGVLSDLTGSPSGATIQVDPVASMAGDFVFALYRAPIDFPGGTGAVGTGIGIEISATSTSGSWTRSLQLHAPPVVLVHGLWSEAKELSGLKNHLTNAGFTICPGCVPDYGLREPAGSFDPFTASLPINVLIQATHSARGGLRNQGIAVCQVDVVGHSLGGLLARARARQ
ncbi:MAG: hypothetical protein GY856_34505, partial [bacterium]|nr:hypothetical protein [bacterium]